MKKSDLQVGVEYACVHSRRDANRYNRYGPRNVTPFKVKVVDLEFSETRLSSSREYRTSDSLLTPSRVYGIAVDTGEKVVVEGRKPKLTKAGVWRRDKPGGRVISEPVREEYDYVVLDDARLIVSTWAEHLAEVRERQQMERERREQEKAEQEALVATETATQKTLDAVLAKLRALYGERMKVESHNYLDKDDTRPTDVSVYQDEDEDGFPSGGLLIEGDIRYREVSTQRESVLAGARFKIDLEELAKLLGVEQ